MSHGQQKPQAEAHRQDAATEQNLARVGQAGKAGRPDFIQHLLSIPKGGPDDLLDRPSLNLRDVAW